MNLQISKCPKPIIWLDTGVIINIKNSQLGKNINPRDLARYIKLYETVYSHVRKNKLICSAGDQGEEYEFGTDSEDCYQIQDSLALGVSFLHRSVIQLRQIIQFAHAYADGEKRIPISYRDVFWEDPIRQLEKDNPNISVRLTPSDEGIALFKREHKTGFERTENLRRSIVAQGIQFPEQLSREYNAKVEVVQLAARNWKQIISENKPPTDEDILQFQAVQPFARVYEIMGSVERTLDFFGSDTYKSIPYIDISCNLYAEVVTSTTPIKSGDYMDVEQLATLLPYCSIFVTDSKMKDRIRRFGFDSKYCTKVYCMSDFDTLISDLETI